MPSRSRKAKNARSALQMTTKLTTGIPDEDLFYGPQDEDIQVAAKKITSMISTVAHSIIDTADMVINDPIVR